MKTNLTIALLACLFLNTTAHAEWMPDPDNKLQLAARKTVASVLDANPDLQVYMDEAYAFAVFPSVVKGAAFWGVTYGKGIVIVADEVVGNCSQISMDLGPQAGGQLFEQIIFFRSKAALQEFQKGRLEFQGRAGVAVANKGVNATPSHLPEVAIVTKTRMGLLFHAAAGATKFRYQAL